MTFNRIFIVAPLLAVAVAAGFRAVAADPASEATTLKQVLSREYVRYNRALAAKNIPAILDMLTPDFAWNVGDGKTLNRQQTRAALQEYLDGIHVVKQAAFRLETVSSQAPGRARVVVVETVTAVVPGERGAGRRERTTTERLRETWVRTGSGWKVKKSEILDSKETFAAVAR